MMAKILGASKVTARYQVTIPEDVRNKMEIKIGQTLVFSQEDDKIILMTEV